MKVGITVQIISSSYAPGDVFRDGLFAAVVFYDKKDHSKRYNDEKHELYPEDAVKDSVYVAGGIGGLGDKHGLSQPVPEPDVCKGEKNDERECEDGNEEHDLQYPGLFPQMHEKIDHQTRPLR